MPFDLFKRKFRAANRPSEVSQTPTSADGRSGAQSPTSSGSQFATASYRTDDSWPNGIPVLHVDEESKYKAVRSTNPPRTTELIIILDYKVRLREIGCQSMAPRTLQSSEPAVWIAPPQIARNLYLRARGSRSDSAESHGEDQCRSRFHHVDRDQ